MIARCSCGTGNWPVPLLPSGPGGVRGVPLRRTRLSAAGSCSDVVSHAGQARLNSNPSRQIITFAGPATGAIAHHQSLQSSEQGALHNFVVFRTMSARRLEVIVTRWHTRTPAAIKGEMETDNLRIGLIQMACEREPAANLEKAARRIEQAAADGAQIVCLQELYRSWYPCQSEDNGHFDLAEPIPGPSSERLGRIAAARKIVIIAPIFERRTAGVYHNSALVLDSSGALAGHYRKMHIPDDPGYYEKFYFAPGDLDFICHRAGPADIGVLICWDQWFPEAARLTAMSGAQVLFYPTAIGWTADMSTHTREKMFQGWETIQRSHSIANGVFVAAVNRVGVEDDIEFWGGSFVSDPFGEVIARASRTNEETLMVDCDLTRIEQTRRDWPFLRDRRIDAYADLSRRLRG